MRPIAIFYHCIFTGGSRPIDCGFACSVMQEQMAALKNSGLLNAASEFVIGVNGDQEDANIAKMLSPSISAQIIAHGKRATTEIPTMNLIRPWIKNHPDSYVFYHHTKGITHPGPGIEWRRRMERHCVWHWQKCVADLDSGLDACGCHWLTPEQFPGAVSSPFFGGTFWWATARYLLTIPPLPPATWGNRYHAESWIGYGPVRPNVRDYAPGWPTE